MAVVATALLAGCATGRGGAGATPTATPDQSVVCRQPDGVTMQRSVDDCLRVARSLDQALSDALAKVLPPGATISNNTFDQNGEFGGPGIQFHRTRAESGGERYETSVRVRDGGTPYNLRVELMRYDRVPPENRCAVDPATASDRQSKGIVTVECGQSVKDGATVFRSLTGYPSGSGDAAKQLTPNAVVEVYRTDGELVRVSFEPVPEKAPSGVASGMLPLNLTMEQLVAIAKSPDLTVG
jgi:hypothetical protein